MISKIQHNIHYYPNHIDLATSKLTWQEKLLHQAVCDGNIIKVENFLQQHINPNIIVHGYSLLMIAILKNMNNNLSLIKLLLSYNADPNLETLTRYTPLYVAIWFGKKDIVLTLLAYKANLNKNYRDKIGNTLLHTAVTYGYWEITKLLLDQGFNLNDLNQKLQTPLCIAVIKKNPDIIELLLEYNADLLINNNNPDNLTTKMNGRSNNPEIINLFTKFQDSFKGKSNIKDTLDFLNNNIDHNALLKNINKKLILNL